MQTVAPTYYEVLGIGEAATPEEVRQAYLRLAKIAHPDAGGSDSAFQLVEEAAYVLGDQWRRAEYDRQLRELGSPAPRNMSDAAGSGNYQGTQYGTRNESAHRSSGQEAHPFQAPVEPITFLGILRRWKSPTVVSFAILLLGFAAYRTGVSALVVHAHPGQSVLFGFHWYPNPVRLGGHGNTVLTAVKLAAVVAVAWIASGILGRLWVWRERQGNFGRRERKVVLGCSLVLAVVGPFVLAGSGTTLLWLVLLIWAGIAVHRSRVGVRASKRGRRH